jgi:hypothetical protein
MKFLCQITGVIWRWGGPGTKSLSFAVAHLAFLFPEELKRGAWFLRKRKKPFLPRGGKGFLFCRPECTIFELFYFRFKAPRWPDGLIFRPLMLFQAVKFCWRRTRNFPRDKFIRGDDSDLFLTVNRVNLIEDVILKGPMRQFDFVMPYLKFVEIINKADVNALCIDS